MPTPLTGAAAIPSVAVPWLMRTLRWVRSSVGAGGASAGSMMRSRQRLSGVSGSSGTARAWVRVRSTSGSAKVRRSPIRRAIRRARAAGTSRKPCSVPSSHVALVAAVAALGRWKGGGGTSGTEIRRLWPHMTRNLRMLVEESPRGHFVAGCRRGALLYQWDGTQAVFPPKVLPGLEWRESAGAGTVYASTTIRPRGGEPRVVSLVDLDEGFRMMSRTDAPIGARVQVVFEDGVPVFRASS